MTDTSFFSMNNVTAGYGRQSVLQDVSFSLEKGTLTALLGANGSGKSTLLKVICNLLPHTGNCRLNGLITEELSTRQIARQISYLPQRNGITVSLSVLEVVIMGFHPVLRLLEKPSRRQRETALLALRSVGMEDFAEHDYLTLSEGQKQLCNLARTLIEDTSLLLLDEPDSALDFHNRYRMLHTLRNMIVNQKRAGLLCLHDPALALDFCDQLLLLKDGRCIASLHPQTDSLADMEEALRQVFGPVSLMKIPDRQNRRRLVMLSELTANPAAPEPALPPVGCVIMASGLGKRFGGNKLLADFNGQPLIASILAKTDSPIFARRIVVTRHPEVAGFCRERGVEALLHNLPNRNDTVRLGLTELLKGTALRGCMFCTADQPLIRSESLESIVRTFSRFPDSICRPAYEEQAGNPILFGENYFPELLSLPVGKGGSYLAKKYPEQVHYIPVRDEYELSDIDTPHDLEHLLHISKEA